MFEQFKDQILFRFSIGACDDQILSYWEPNAPGYDERKESLIVAHQEGFQTSVSVEPMLDSVHIATLIGELLPYVSQSLWIGKMNHLGRFGKGSDMVLQQAIKEIKRGQADSIIKSIYRWYKDDPLIKWKKEIKRVVGIPIPKQNGLDI
jgi:DNA repair photolyase